MKKHTKLIGGERAIKVSVQTVIYAILIIFVFLVGVGSILAYGTNTEIGEKIATKISKVVPFPAAIVSWNHIVYLSDLEKNVASLEQFYRTQSFSDEGLRVDFTTELGKKRLEIKKREVLDKMVEDQIIEILANRKGIEITDANADSALKAKLKEFGTTNDVKADLMKSYGWDMNDFKKQVVLPSMYTEALSKLIVQNNQSDSQAKEKIVQAQNELKTGVDFAAVAIKYSEGSSKSNGGELGWVKKDQVVPELSVLFDSSNVDNNAIIESSIGYHIAQIENKKKEGGKDVLKLRQIFVAKNTFADWLDKQKKQMNVWVPMNEFIWNSGSATIDFRDEQMRKFESVERSKAQGDASLLF